MSAPSTADPADRRDAGPGHLSRNAGLSWAVFIARIHVGLLFLMPGIFRVFQLGPAEHARRFFVEPYADTVLPAWSLWLTGSAVPFLELVGGGLLLLGLWRGPVLVLLGLELAMITFGHLLTEPVWAMHSHVFPRLALILFLLAVGLNRDHWALDLRRSAPA